MRRNHSIGGFVIFPEVNSDNTALLVLPLCEIPDFNPHLITSKAFLGHARAHGTCVAGL